MGSFRKFVFSIVSFLFKTRTDINYIYDSEFFKDNINRVKFSAKCIGDIIMGTFHPKSVLDIGCATGVYLKEFYDKGIEIQGVEGSSKAQKHLLIPPEYFLIHDLRYPLRLNRKYDVCICFEVAEHIPTKSSQNLVDILTQHSDTVIFTAAPPGQGGKNHINEQPISFWDEIFEKANFIKEHHHTKKLKSQMKNQDVVGYMCRNVTVYRRQQT